MRNKHIITLTAAALLATACTDLLTGETVPAQVHLNSTDTATLGFDFSVNEVADQLVEIGRTRAAMGQSGIVVTDCPPQNRLLQGGETLPPLYVNRVEMAAIGGQPGAACQARTADDAPTRASALDIIKTSSNNFPDSVTIFGVAFKGAVDDYETAANTQRRLFPESGTLLKHIRDWRCSVHWPYESDWMRFCAIAPCVEQTNIDIERGPSYGEELGTYKVLPPIFNFTVNDDVRLQRDMLYGTSGVINVQAGPSPGSTDIIYDDSTHVHGQHLGLDDKRVQLSFYHVLTAVRFARGTLPEGFQIINIRLENIQNSGKFYADPDPSVAYWDVLSSVSHYDVASYYTSPAHSGIASGDAAYYIDDNQVLFLMPQTLRGDAKLIVTLRATRQNAEGDPVDLSDNVVTDGNYVYMEGSTHTASVSLSGDEWRKGYLYTYVLSLEKLGTGYGFSVTSTTAPLEHNSNIVNSTTQMQIDSYAQRTDYSARVPVTEQSGTPIGFTLTGFSSDGSASTNLMARPDWLTSVSTSAPAGNTYTVSFNFARQEWDTSKPNGNHKNTLQTNTGKSNVDLSLKNPNGNDYAIGGSMRWTANSYIVNRPGTYRIPAVYGNAITAGTTDLSANTVKDHLGNLISHAWINTQLTSAPTTTDAGAAGQVTTQTSYEYDARVLWQEAPSLISSLSTATYGGNLFLTFRADESNIQPGNAVVALKGRPITTTTTWVSTTPDGNASLYGQPRYNVHTSTTADGLTTTTTWQKVEKDGDDYVTQSWQEVISRTSTEYSETLWTWLVWVSDEVYPNKQENGKLIAVTNKSAETNSIMPVNLGWVPTGYKNDYETVESSYQWGSYSVRQTYATFKQNGGTNNTIARLFQHARPDLPTGHAVTYRWGDMMPLPEPGVTVYDAFGSEIADHSSIERFTPAGASWSTTGKTLTDPCPPGFRVPVGSVFSGMSLTGTHPTVDGANLNLWPDGVNTNPTTVKNGMNGVGGYFYATPHSSLTDVTAFGLGFDEMLAERYGKDGSDNTYTYVPNPSMFYMPAGTYWTSSSGTTLFVQPDRTETSTVVDWAVPAANDAEHVVRPMGTYPTTP